MLAGKVDGIVRIGGDYFILEHKTAAQLDSDYLERLWTDFQITIYAYYIEQTMGIPITGILYNVLVKAKLQQSKGRDGGGIPGAARGTAGEVENRQEHGEAPDAGDG